MTGLKRALRDGANSAGGRQPRAPQRAVVRAYADAGAGQGLVEFALLAPVILLLLLGTFDVARGAGSYIALTNAARAGARYAVLHSGDAAVTECAWSAGPGAGLLAASPCGVIAAQALAIAPQLTQGQVTAVSLQYRRYIVDDGSGGTLAAQVTLRYRFQPLTGLAIGGAITLSAAAVTLQQ